MARTATDPVRRRGYGAAIDATSCSRCGAPTGTAPDTMPLGWSTATTDDGVKLLCDVCTRAHARDIESKLDDAWWERDPPGAG